MVDYVTVEPTEEEGYLRGFKLPFITSEILTVENSVLLDRDSSHVPILCSTSLTFYLQEKQ